MADAKMRMSYLLNAALEGANSVSTSASHPPSQESSQPLQSTLDQRVTLPDSPNEPPQVVQATEVNPTVELIVRPIALTREPSELSSQGARRRTIHDHSHTNVSASSPTEKNIPPPLTVTKESIPSLVPAEPNEFTNLTPTSIMVASQSRRYAFQSEIPTKSTHTSHLLKRRPPKLHFPDTPRHQDCSHVPILVDSKTDNCLSLPVSPASCSSSVVDETLVEPSNGGSVVDVESRKRIRSLGGRSDTTEERPRKRINVSGCNQSEEEVKFPQISSVRREQKAVSNGLGLLADVSRIVQMTPGGPSTKVVRPVQSISPSVQPKAGAVSEANLINRRTRRPPKPKRFACHCGRPFSKREHLKRHDQLVHRLERPYSCTVCNAHFGTKQNMQVHLTTRKHQLNVASNRDKTSPHTSVLSQSSAAS